MSEDDQDTIAIRVEGLEVSYGEQRVLEGLSFELRRGEVFGYIGRNGAGKTTTVRVLTGIHSDFEGSVRIGPNDVRDDPLAVKSCIGYVPETAALYTLLSPVEYLGLLAQVYGVAAAEDRIRRLLELFGLASEAESRMTTFSKGMKQKVLIIAALFHDPEIVFLDEPLSGLDAQATVLMKELIAALASAGKTVFYCSHLLDVVERVCDRIAILDGGRIRSIGSFEELQAGRDDASLEGIFTELIAAGGQEERARNILEAIVA